MRPPGWLGLGAVLSMIGCGRIGFDETIGDTWEFSSPRAIYVYNDVMPSLTHPIAENSPIVTTSAATFSVEPDLAATTGLSFDSVTGVISGRPSRTSPWTDYVVTGVADGLAHEAHVAIRTAPGFYVDDPADVSDVSATDNDCVSPSGTCTLRAAVEQLAAFDATPRVALLRAFTVTLAGADVRPTQPIEVIGAGRDATAINAGGLSRVFDFGLQNTAIISDVTLRNGRSGASGGCVAMVGGSITIRDAAFESCTAAGDGGGAWLDDSFGTYPMSGVVERVAFVDNRADDGGGISAANGVGSSSMEIRDCTFERNRAGTYGSAIMLNAGPVLVESSLLTGNTGAPALGSQDGTTITLRNTTVSDNVGTFCGGVSTNNATTLIVESSTIVDNTCDNCSGGAGINQNSGGSLSLRGSIVAGNIDLNLPGVISNCHLAGPVTAMSLGNNLTDTSTSCLGVAAGDQFDRDPMLDPVADNGGPVRTRALKPGSPAIDGGGQACPAVDARGLRRPVGAACDVGAFERQ